MPKPARIVHLVILKILATGVSLQPETGLLTHLGKIEQSLKATRFPSSLHRFIASSLHRFIYYEKTYA